MWGKLNPVCDQVQISGRSTSYTPASVISYRIRSCNLVRAWKARLCEHPGGRLTTERQAESGNSPAQRASNSKGVTFTLHMNNTHDCPQKTRKIRTRQLEPDQS